jgi:hypothetical protein
MPKRKASKCLIASQVVMSGVQEIRVRSFGRDDGWTVPYLSLRIGRIIFNIEDREALYSLAELVKEAQDLTEQTFGPEWIQGRRR